MTSDLLEPTHDDDLDRRLRAAMAEIAADYRPGTIVAAPRPRRSRWLVGAAAAAVAVLGVTGVWALNRQTTGPAASETTAVVPPAPAFGADFTVPDVDWPEIGVRLVPEIVPEDLPVENPYRPWLSKSGPFAVQRWFVATEGDRAVGYVAYVDEPLSYWPNLDQLPDFDSGGSTSVDIRQVGDGQAIWRYGVGVRHVTVVGEAIGLNEAIEIALATDDLTTLAVPAGYTDLSGAGFTTWQYADWSAGTFVAVDEHEAVLYLSTYELDRETRAIEGGLIEPAPEDGARSRAVIRVGNVVTVVSPPDGTTDEELEDAVSGLEIIPAAALPVIPLLALGSSLQPNESDEPVAGGEIDDGRWLALETTVPSEAADGLHCLYFLGVVEGFRGCTDPGTVDLTICRHIDGSDGKRLAMITTETLDPATVTVTANDEPLVANVEVSGGMTFVTTTVDAIGYELRFSSDGRELCTT